MPYYIGAFGSEIRKNCNKKCAIGEFCIISLEKLYFLVVSGSKSSEKERTIYSRRSVKNTCFIGVSGAGRAKKGIFLLNFSKFVYTIDKKHNI